MYKSSFTFGLFVLLIGTAFGDLKWEKLEQSFNATPSEKAVTAHYKFTNTGSGPITIEGVKTSCGCTTAALTKKEYATGESGEIEVNFQFGGRVGPQEKEIFVSTLGAPNNATVLRLFVNIEDPIALQPQFVMWHVGDAPSTKIIQVRVKDDQPGKVVSITSDNPIIKLELKETKPGKEFDVAITPMDLSHPTGATILIKTDFPVENPQTRYVYARVK
jgi:hypothetical protein